MKKLKKLSRKELEEEFKRLYLVLPSTDLKKEYSDKELIEAIQSYYDTEFDFIMGFNQKYIFL